MGRRDQKNNKKAPAPPPKAESPDESGSFIQFGPVMLTNKQLVNLVRAQEAPSDSDSLNDNVVNDNPQTLKEIEAFACQKSKEIVDQAIKNLPQAHALYGPPPSAFAPVVPPRVAKVAKVVPKAPIVAPVAQKPKDNPPSEIFALLNQKEDLIQKQKDILKQESRRPPQPPPKVTSNKSYRNRVHGELHVNPNGADAPYFQTPLNVFYPKTEEILEDLWEQGPSLFENKLYQQRPEDIVRGIMRPDFSLIFPFTMEMHFGMTGMMQRQQYMFHGPDTYTNFKQWYRDKYAESVNFQMFYMNHDGRFMEVRSTHTLKQMLVNHGAYPRGIHCALPIGVGKLFCIPTTDEGEGLINAYMKDTAMGIASEIMLQPDETHYFQLPRVLSPDVHHRKVWMNTNYYSDQELDHVYNQFNSLMCLYLYCQRPMGFEEMYLDPRTSLLTGFEFKVLLRYRWENPYEGCNSEKSIVLETNVILDRLRKSRHQTRKGVDDAEQLLRRLVIEMKREQAAKRAEQDRKNRIQVAKRLRELQAMKANQARHGSGFKEFTVQKALNPALARVEPPQRMEERAFKEFTVHRLLEEPVGKGASMHKVLDDPAGKGLSVQEVLQQARDEYKLIERVAEEDGPVSQEAKVSPAQTLTRTETEQSTQAMLIQTTNLLAQFTISDSSSKQKAASSAPSKTELTPLQKHALLKAESEESENVPIHESLLYRDQFLGDDEVEANSSSCTIHCNPTYEASGVKDSESTPELTTPQKHEDSKTEDEESKTEESPIHEPKLEKKTVQDSSAPPAGSVSMDVATAPPEDPAPLLDATAPPEDPAPLDSTTTPSDRTPLQTQAVVKGESEESKVEVSPNHETLPNDAPESSAPSADSAPLNNATTAPVNTALDSFKTLSDGTSLQKHAILKAQKKESKVGGTPIDENLPGEAPKLEDKAGQDGSAPLDSTTATPEDSVPSDPAPAAPEDPTLLDRTIIPQNLTPLQKHALLKAEIEESKIEESPIHESLLEDAPKVKDEVMTPSVGPSPAASPGASPKKEKLKSL